MQIGMVLEIKREIDQLWEEHLAIREKKKGCLATPQKERALSLMRELARKEGEEGKQWVGKKIVEIRRRLARIDQEEGDFETAALQLQKAQQFLDRHPEFERLNLKRIVRRSADEVG